MNMKNAPTDLPHSHASGRRHPAPAKRKGQGPAPLPGDTMTAGGALLARLKAVGVDYVFANSGTDFPPIIEGLSEAAARTIDLPQALVMPHESAAMGMAHGYYLATGRAQAVMAHTNVGLANCAIGAINAATEQIPMLLFSGRTPTLEQGRLGARTVPIGWGQEMRDQAALVREASKWDYELRFPEQATEIVDRAYAIATSSPPGPVYVSLPREVLCAQCPADDIAAPLSIQPARTRVHPDAIEAAADLLSAAQCPLIVVQRGAGGSEGFAALARIAEDWAIPVSQYWAVQLGLPTNHPLSAGSNPSPWVEEADVILVVDAIAPWAPEIHHPRSDCRIIHLGEDPLYARFPVRNFRSDLSLAGDVQDALVALDGALRRRHAARAEGIEHRRTTLLPRLARIRADVLSAAAAGGGPSMTKDYVSLCLSEAIAGRDAVVLSELGCPLAPMTLTRPNSWYQEPRSGGLGWCFPAALGMQLARRDRLVIATMGDGSYVFSNPAACHQIAEALGLPVLVLVLNNAEWGAVRQSVVGLYPDGYAAKANTMPLTSLAPTPDFARIAAASRAWATTVTDGDALPGTLNSAIAHIEADRRHALIEIRVRP
jgi:acetolactate synthase-1/2/3 large subunit